MGATIVVLKKKLKRTNGKFWDKGKELAVDLSRARQLLASGHIEPFEKAEKQQTPADEKKVESKSETKNN